MFNTNINTDDCWLYAGRKNNVGYGRFENSGVKYMAHRATYEHFKGEIPDGLQIDHLCRIPACINPDHLEAVTARENVLRSTGPPAIYAKRTACKYGHVYTKANTYMRGNNRVCRACARDWARDYFFIKKNRNKILLYVYCTLYSNT